MSRQLYVNTDPATPQSSTHLLQGQGEPGTPASVQAAFAQGPSGPRLQTSSLQISESPYGRVASPAVSLAPSISDKFSLSPDPRSWGARLDENFAEPDDALHNPDPRRDRKIDKGGSIFTARGLANLGCLFILAAGLVTLFAGYPIIIHFTEKKPSNLGGFNIGGTNATGQIAELGNMGLIDTDTPDDARTIASYIDGSELELVFSDEFNQDGRTFYPGDDPYWEAVNLHYWQTNNLEWYDPSQITTSDGSLKITLTDNAEHGMNYTGGMLSTWNKFCFTGGLFQVSVVIPGTTSILGLWPAVWAMGNLGRAGYGASLEGMWPYTYDACDVGTLQNQTLNGQPVAATENGDPTYDGVLSFLPGQRLSRCTCSGESHPGPVHSDGSYVGRSAPEIDVFESTVSDDVGYVSQSAQWGPFNNEYIWDNSSANLIIPDTDITELNPYQGGAYQQATSGLSQSNQSCYELEEGCFAIYGFEYKPGFDDAYIGWINNGELAWQLNVAGMAADSVVEISARPVPQEPMYLIMNLGMSENFGYVDLDHLTFPTTMSVDYVRVYQRSDSKNIGCDPPDFPTAAYINEYLEAYTNPNLTTWRDDFGQPFPKNNLTDTC